jgi:hypothetical protein
MSGHREDERRWAEATMRRARKEDERRWIAAMERRHARGLEYVCGLADVLAVIEERDEARAEVEMLRGVGCRETKADEPESGPCGVCLKCAEERGAEWALDSVGWSRKDDRRPIARRVCADVRKGSGR